MKNYGARNVRLTDAGIRGEIEKDLYLMEQRQNYRAVWVFIEKGPNEDLIKELENAGIDYLIIE